MASLVAWLDYSDDDRRRMREVIDLFRESDTLDELGIGSLRDTIADLLFPGTSTIQTRARYFLLVPWVFLDIEQRRLSGREAHDATRRRELALIGALERGGVGGGRGVIGWEARENLRTVPSSIYWGGLGALGIRQFHGTSADYLRSLDGYYRRLDHHMHGDGDEVHERITPNWHPALPSPPAGLFEETTLDLTFAEAEYLSGQIRRERPASLLAHLLKGPLVDVPFPWLHPALESAPSGLAALADHARRFSEVMHGAALTYNRMLAIHALNRGMSGPYQERENDYAARLDEWATQVAGIAGSWDVESFWQTIDAANPRIRLLTRAFVNEWIRFAGTRLGDVIGLADDVQTLIRRRERQLKGSQSRLISQRALERWNGQSGTRRLDFRWGISGTVIRDIKEGLARAEP